MSKLKCCWLGMLIVTACSHGTALAWGDQAHRAVGLIAERLLVGSHAQKEIANLLLAGETLADATVWADCAKGRFCGAPTEEMRLFVAANPQHNDYHINGTPMGQDQYRPGGMGSAENDIVQTMQQCIAVLQGQTDGQSNPHQFTRRQALLLLVHLVGDIHQPLHAGAPYMDGQHRFVTPRTKAEVDELNIFNLRGDNNLLFADPAYDRVLYAGSPVAPQNLHYYWDITVFELAMAQRGAVDASGFAAWSATQARPVMLTTGSVTTWPKQWADRSLQLVTTIHAGVVPEARKTNTRRNGEVFYTWGVRVPSDYRETSLALATQQVMLAGVQLAATLEKIWP